MGHVGGSADHFGAGCHGLSEGQEPVALQWKDKVGENVPGKDGSPGEERTVMKFHPRLAPVKAAVFPLVNKDGMPEKAMKLYRELKPFFNVFFDDKGAVGRRYRRQDEAGTPFCVTIDGDTMKDDTVTVRDRDTLKQERVPMSQVRAVIERALTPGV